MLWGKDTQQKDPNVDALYLIMEKAKKYDKLTMPFKNKELHCSFCGKSQSAIKRLIAGPGVYICDESVELCHDIIVETDENIQEEQVDNKGDGDTKL